MRGITAAQRQRSFGRNGYLWRRWRCRSRARLAPGGARRGTGRRATAARQRFSRSLQCAQTCSGSGDLGGSGMVAHSEPGAASLAAGHAILQPRPHGRARQAQQQGHLLRWQHLFYRPLFRVRALPKRTETDPARLAAPGCSRLDVRGPRTVSPDTTPPAPHPALAAHRPRQFAPARTVHGRGWRD